MKTKIIEATQGKEKGFNWGKFLVGQMDTEWRVPSMVGTDSNAPLLRQCGWSHEHVWVLDLQTGEGAFFRLGGYAPADLNKHEIWVCPMYEPLLVWLYEQPISGPFVLEELPSLVELPDAPAAFAGYRRPGQPRPAGDRPMTGDGKS